MTRLVALTLSGLSLIILLASIPAPASAVYPTTGDGSFASDSATVDPSEAEKKKVTVDEAKVYLGSPKKFKKAGVVNLAKIFKETEPYKKILREKLDRNDPKYRILLVEANKIAKKAMQRIRDQEGYDLIVEEGHLTIEGEDVSDITDKVIEALDS